MANWCSNTITLAGPKEQILGVMDAMKKMCIDLMGSKKQAIGGLAVLMQRPDDGCEAIWSVDDPVELERLEEGESFTFFGETRWSPLSTKGLCSMSAMFPDLHIRHEYDESGSMFAGVSIIHNGVEVDSLYVEGDDYFYEIEDTVEYIKEINNLPVEDLPPLLADYEANSEYYEQEGIGIEYVLKAIRARLEGDMLNLEDIPMYNLSEM